MARTRQPVTGKFKPRKDRELRPDEHHLGWDRALQEARAYTAGFSILDVQLDPHNLSGALQRLTAALAKRVK